MNSQDTAPEIIEHERQIVKNLAGLTSTAEITFNDSGWDSRVYEVANGKYYFKFPRSDKIKGRYKYEIKAVKLLAATNTDINVQKIIWEHPENNYFGYEGVQGVLLSSSLENLSTEQKAANGKQIGMFLKDLHTLELPGARVVPIAQEIKQFQEWYEPALPTLQKALTTAEREKLKQLVANIWPAVLQHLGSESRLCHGDFHFKNILVDKDGKLGVIDFGDVGYYDNSKDFINLRDDRIFEAALKTYGDSDLLREKIAMRRTTFLIIRLTANIGKKDEQGVQNTLLQIKRVLA